MTIIRLPFGLLAAVAIIVAFLFVSSSKADETYQPPTASLPGTSVMIGRPPIGTVLDNFGCAQLTPSRYQCYAGMLAGQQFSNRQEALMTYRIAMNPGFIAPKNASEFANGGSVGSRGFENMNQTSPGQ